LIAIELVIAEDWECYCQRVIKTENLYWEKDMKCSSTVQQTISLFHLVPKTVTDKVAVNQSLKNVNCGHILVFFW